MVFFLVLNLICKKQVKAANITLEHKVLVQLEKDIEDINAFRRELDTVNNAYLKTLNRSV
jgi:hypothetical protein